MKTLLALLGTEAAVILASLYIPTRDETVGMAITTFLIIMAVAMIVWVTRGRIK